LPGSGVAARLLLVELQLPSLHQLGQPIGRGLEVRPAREQIAGLAADPLSLLLPRSDKELTRSLEDGSAPTLQPGTRVLLVEDNDQVRAFANDLLHDLGCEVLCAASADDALTCLNGAEVDVVLSDIVMPGMSGIELASRLKQTHPRLPVVLATGYSEQAAQGVKNTPIILKPYSGTDVSAALAQAMAALPRDLASAK
jgi:CheY-like chemotaxis protein